MFKSRSIYKQLSTGCMFGLIFTTSSREGWLMFGIQTVFAIVAFTCAFLETRREFANQEIGHGGRQFKNIAAVSGFVFCMVLLGYHHFWSV